MLPQSWLQVGDCRAASEIIALRGRTNAPQTQDMLISAAAVPNNWFWLPGSRTAGSLYNFLSRQMICQSSAYQEKSPIIISAYKRQKNW